jgi:hypothetical protein
MASREGRSQPVSEIACTAVSERLSLMLPYGKTSLDLAAYRVKRQAAAGEVSP